MTDTGSLVLVVTCQGGLQRMPAPPEGPQPPFDDDDDDDDDSGGGDVDDVDGGDDDVAGEGTGSGSD